MNHISKINLSNESWDATSENLIFSGVYEEKIFSQKLLNQEMLMVKLEQVILFIMIIKY